MRMNSDVILKPSGFALMACPRARSGAGPSRLFGWKIWRKHLGEVIYTKRTQGRTGDLYQAEGRSPVEGVLAGNLEM